MALPSKQVFQDPSVTIPNNFDPEKHCGWKIGNTICMDPAEEPGSCCAVHDRVKAVMPAAKDHYRRAGNFGHELEGIKPRSRTLLEMAEAYRTSEDLLTLDGEIAIMKVYLREHFNNVDDAIQYAEEVINKIGEGVDDDGKPMALLRQSMFPKLDLDAIKTLNSLITTAYNMRFSKRFSIPIPEMQAILMQLAAGYRDIAKKYGIPQAATEEFVNLISGLRVARPLDAQLDRAGGVQRDEPLLVGESKW